MLKRFLILSIMMLTTNSVFANNADFSKILSESTVSKSGVSVVVQDLKTGKDIYKHHPKQYFHPASVQKMITYKVAEDKLGRDYKFNTILYKNNQNEYLIKLAADPLFTTADLKQLVSHIEPNATAIYIDDTIVDVNEWGTPTCPKLFNWDYDFTKSTPELRLIKAPSKIKGDVNVSF